MNNVIATTEIWSWCADNFKEHFDFVDENDNGVVGFWKWNLYRDHHDGKYGEICSWGSGFGSFANIMPEKFNNLSGEFIQTLSLYDHKKQLLLFREGILRII